MDDCIFCKILKGEIPSNQVYEDDQVLAFRDINPAAPTHVLVIPKEHIASVNDVTEKHEQLMGHILAVVKPIADQEGISESGYRLIINHGPDGHQEVDHLHLHILGGQPMKHRMG